MADITNQYISGEPTYNLPNLSYLKAYGMLRNYRRIRKISGWAIAEKLRVPATYIFNTTIQPPDHYVYQMFNLHLLAHVIDTPARVLKSQCLDFWTDYKNVLIPWGISAITADDVPHVWYTCKGNASPSYLDNIAKILNSLGGPDFSNAMHCVPDQ